MTITKKIREKLISGTDDALAYYLESASRKDLQYWAEGIAGLPDDDSFWDEAYKLRDARIKELVQALKGGRVKIVKHLTDD